MYPFERTTEPGSVLHDRALETIDFCQQIRDSMASMWAAAALAVYLMVLVFGCTKFVAELLVRCRSKCFSY